MDALSLALAKKYTDDTVKGYGAVKGKNCTIQSIEAVDGGNNVIFGWTSDDGTAQTQTMFVANGSGGDGVSGEITASQVSYCGTNQGDSQTTTVQYILDEICIAIMELMQSGPNTEELSQVFTEIQRQLQTLSAEVEALKTTIPTSGTVSLWSGRMTSAGSYELSDDPNNYPWLIVEHGYKEDDTIKGLHYSIFQSGYMYPTQEYAVLTLDENARHRMVFTISEKTFTLQSNSNGVGVITNITGTQVLPTT